MEIQSYNALVAAARATRPAAAVILGSGMGTLADRLRVEHSTSFLEIPDLPAPTVKGHPGRLLLGDWAGKRVLVFLGRLHYYEGVSWRDVVAPVRLAHFLGARILLLTNAAGGIRDGLGAGSLLAIRDHIEWARSRAWMHPGPGTMNPGRPSPYSSRMIGLLRECAAELRLSMDEGVYAAVTGPSYETPAEIRALKAWGADAVGMSTAREIQTGRDLGMECAAVSLIANRAAGLGACPIEHAEVLRAATAGRGPLTNLIEAFLPRL
jgi:purine-nucleoside phosphorylase